VPQHGVIDVSGAWARSTGVRAQAPFLVVGSLSPHISRMNLNFRHDICPKSSTTQRFCPLPAETREVLNG
jgi:hypothetical protein